MARLYDGFGAGDDIGRSFSDGGGKNEWHGPAAAARLGTLLHRKGFDRSHFQGWPWACAVFECGADGGAAGASGDLSSRGAIIVTPYHQGFAPKGG
jgi:hypothetical protein